MHADHQRPPTRLLVLRHGESEWNASGRWQGQADVALTEEGRRQAATAALRLGTFDAVVASDLQRAALTAAIIAEIIGVGPVILDSRLREADVGPWEGLTHPEVEEGWPGFLAHHHRPEGFEPYEAVAARATAALREVAAGHPGGEILVVTHGGLIRALRRELAADDVRVPNLAGSWFVVREGRLAAGELVHGLAAHDEPAVQPGAQML